MTNNVINNPQLQGNGIIPPANFNTTSGPGKLEALLNSNGNDVRIYTKLSPKTNYMFGPSQPFYTVSIPEAKKGINGIYSSTEFPLGNGLRDVSRISRFFASRQGIIYNIKQFALQATNPFNETKLYNPLSPLQAVLRPTLLGAVPRPTRHLDLSSVSSALGFAPNNTPPKGTLAAALPTQTNDGGKGLLRARTASAARSNLEAKFTARSSSRSTLLQNIGNYFKSSLSNYGISKLPKQTGKYRNDDGAYILMSKSYVFDIALGEGGDKGATNKKYSETNQYAFQRWYAFENPESLSAVRYKRKRLTVRQSIGRGDIRMASIDTTSTLSGTQLTSSPLSTDSAKYGDNIGITVDGNEKSDILEDFKKRVDSTTSKDFSSTFSNPADPVVQNLKTDLKTLLNKMEREGYSFETYNGALYNNVIPGGLPAFRPNSATLGQTWNEERSLDQPNVSPENKNWTYAENYNKFVLNEKQVRGAKTKDIASGNNYGMSTTNKADTINSTGVLRTNNTSYKPYEDDLIAFYFEDIVNEKIIPFRATVTGVSEQNSAIWNEIRYLGRSDKIGYYTGFTRNLTFSFKVVISSVKELLPSWQKINYIASSVKPANYVNTGSPGKAYTQFIIAPMFRVSIGDMYKNQPVLISSVNINIPEDATWETLPEDYAKTEDWSYMRGALKLNNSKGRYAQLPKEVEINISADILEKERPIVGGAQYGDYYREINLADGTYSSSADISRFSSNMVVENNLQ